MIYRYEIGYGGETLAITYSYKKAIKHANSVLDIINKNKVGDDDYRLLTINRFSLLDNYTLIIWSEIEKKYIKF